VQVIPKKPRKQWITPKGATVCGILFVIAFHFAAVLVYSARPTYNDDFTPDAVVNMSAAAFMSDRGMNNTPTPLRLEFVDPRDGATELRLAGSYGDTKTGRRTLIEVRQGEDSEWVQFPYDKIDWRVGPVPIITMAFGNEEVKVAKVGLGYSYWRFMTFRGAESYFYFSDTADNAARLSEVIADAKTVTITIPNTPKWQKAKTIGK